MKNIILNWPKETLPEERMNKIRSQFVKSFVTSLNFASANSQSQLLLKYEPFTEEEANMIVEGFISNNQISDGFQARVMVKQIRDQYESIISEENKTGFDKMWTESEAE